MCLKDGFVRQCGQFIFLQATDINLKEIHKGLPAGSSKNILRKYCEELHNR